MLLQDLFLPHGRFQRNFGELACAYYLRRKSRRLSVLIVVFHGMVFCGIVDEEILTALGHLPKYPTCSKAMCWYGIRCGVNFAWPIDTSLQFSSAPCSGLRLLHDWTGGPMRVHPFCSDEGFSESQWVPKGCLGFPGAFHCVVLLYYGRQVCEV